MTEDEATREAVLAAMADEIRARMATPAEDHLGMEEAFAAPALTAGQVRSRCRNWLKSLGR